MSRLIGDKNIKMSFIDTQAAKLRQTPFDQGSPNAAALVLRIHG
jgi:hypothetical protein